MYIIGSRENTKNKVADIFNNEIYRSESFVTIKTFATAPRRTGVFTRFTYAPSRPFRKSIPKFMPRSGECIEFVIRVNALQCFCKSRD